MAEQQATDANSDAKATISIDPRQYAVIPDEDSLLDIE
jgi:hypothetical protein